MQQTENYKLNLIETSDPFSPAPLNENAEKLETVLSAKADAADTAALDARVQVLELHKFYAGAYIGNGEKTNDEQFIDLGFTPALVVLKATGSIYIVSNDFSYPVVQLASGGFKVFKKPNPYGSDDANATGTTYSFFAIC